MYKKINFFCSSVLLEGGDEIRSLSKPFCDEILPPPNRHPFFKTGGYKEMSSIFADQ